MDRDCNGSAREQPGGPREASGFHVGSIWFILWLYIIGSIKACPKGVLQHFHIFPTISGP